MTNIYEDYLKAGTSFDRLSVTGTTGVSYGRFNGDRRPMLPMVDTGLIYCGDPGLLKRFYGIRFGGGGKIYVRAMVENTEVSRGYVTLSEDAYQSSVYRLPRGCAGFGLRLQLVGIAWWRYFEIDWDPFAEGQ